jgi:RNA polymerase sigma-70 factor (ECF subfamily)
MTIAPGEAGPDDPDSQLLSAVAHGDERAFRALYRRHTPRLRMLVLRMLGGHASDTDDAVQETWIRAVAGVSGFRGESNFGTWLTGIGVRVAWGTIRRRRPALAMMPDDEPAVDPPDTGERLDLDEALRRLPDQYRTVVVLHDVEGYSHEEIAESLGVAVGTSRSTLSRARQALRAMLSSYERILR